MKLYCADKLSPSRPKACVYLTIYLCSVGIFIKSGMTGGVLIIDAHPHRDRHLQAERECLKFTSSEQVSSLKAQFSILHVESGL